jgi:hypothetical protein
MTESLFFGVAESDNGIDNFRFWDYPILLDDTCKEETNVYDMRLTQHEDGWIYGVFCSESHDDSTNDLSAAVAAAGIVRTKDLKKWSDFLILLQNARLSREMLFFILSLLTENMLFTPAQWTALSIPEAAVV